MTKFENKKEGEKPKQPKPTFHDPKARPPKRDQRLNSRSSFRKSGGRGR